MYIHRDRCGFHIPHSQTSKSPVSKFNFEPTLLFGVRSCHGHGLVVVCGRWLLQLHPMKNVCKLEIQIKNDRKLDIGRILVPDVHGIYSRNGICTSITHLSNFILHLVCKGIL